MTRLLIVDDHEQNLYMLQVLLQGHGYEVALAANGVEALETARRDPPDMIISDILMPVMDGFALCRAWKKDEQLNHIPFVFYTATYTDPKDEEFALNLGAERFLVKPIEPELFVEILQEVIETYQVDQLVAPRQPIVEETVYLREYNETLIRKLENAVMKLEQEIAERKRAEETLRTERDKAQRYLDIAGVIILALAADQKVTLINKKGCQILGYKEKEIVDKNWFDNFVPERDRERTKSAFAMLMAGEIEPVEYFENPVWTKNGQERLIAWHNTVLTDETGQVIGTLSSGEDITQRKRAEEELRQAQKMEAIGRLAGGVAHDFNNLLTAMMGYAGLALQALSPHDPVCHDIEGIQETARRATNLTRQLLTFARKQVIHPTVLNLNDLVLDVDKILRRLIGEDIELVTLAAPDLGPIKADPGQLEQVLLNLAVNARDAMPNGGKLTIETANVILDEAYARQHPEVTPGEHVMLSVSDTGVGMTEEVKTHLFEPFFTTKEAGKGTGFGLATCFGIVKQSGGHIWVYSEVNRGTTFKIYLPRVEKALSPGLGQGKSNLLPRGTETILLVEDEPSVRELAVRTLGQQGYKVLEAANGDEALRLVQEQPQATVHLVLTDVIMPRLGGKELVARLQTMYPHLKVLFISGYTDNAIVHHGVLEPGIAFLSKPFSPRMLARKVREVLDS